MRPRTPAPVARIEPEEPPISIEQLLDDEREHWPAYPADARHRALAAELLAHTHQHPVFDLRRVLQLTGVGRVLWREQRLDWLRREFARDVRFVP